MEYRRFGRTELQMPVFSCGGMRYQHTWGDQPLDQIPAESNQNVRDTMLRALELGINHFETARGYGPSERQMGPVLRELARDRIIVQTKVGAGPNSDEWTANVKDSIKRMQVGYLDLITFHGINDYESLHHAARDGGCLQAARRLQKQGLVRHVGFSTHGDPSAILDAVKHDRDGGFDYINIHWYYIYQRNWAAIEEATRRDMGVFIISPNDKGGRLFDPPDRLVELCAPLHPIVFNALFCLSHPEVHTLSLGAAKPSDFDIQMETFEHLDNAASVIKPIMKRLDQAVTDVVGADFAKSWREGIPEWRSVPCYANIYMVTWLYLLAKAFDMGEYCRGRYNLLGNGGSWFGGNNASAAANVDVAKVLGDHPHRERIAEIYVEAQELLGGEAVKRLSES
ncbi:MAG: aldo/keto reductase [Planctomycetaceae bacterium]|nr:aldo/keto reductase [Planctomycetaceae bacterium]